MMIFIIGIGIFVGAKFGIFNGIILSIVLLYFFRNHLDSGSGDNSGFSQSRRNQINSKFIENIFGLFGKMAKAKGVVEKADLYSALNLMKSMRINADNEELAKAAFNRGKESSFDFNLNVRELKNLFATDTQVLKMVLEILVQVALIDGNIDTNERKLLNSATQILGFKNSDLEKIINSFKMHANTESSYDFEEDFNKNSGKTPLDMAYEVLELDKNATYAETKKQYKRMISKNHPDKLIAKKMPEKIIEMAKKKTQKINQAYDFICKQKNWN